MKLEKTKQGIYHATYWTPYGTRTVTTRATTKEEAGQVVKRSKIQEIEQAAKAGALTQSAISQMLVGKNVTTSQAAQEWAAWLELNTGSKFTVTSYQQVLHRWITDMDLAEVMPSMIKPEHISQWINRKCPAKLSSRQMWMSVIREFFKFLTGTGYAFANPALLVTIHWQDLTHEQKEMAIKEVFTEAEFARLLAAADAWDIKSHSRHFWGVAVRLGRYLGLRLGDICNLEWAALEKPGYIRVWTRKRNMAVTLPLDEPELKQAIHLIQHEHEEFCFWPERSLTNDPRARSRLSKYFQRLCERAGIEGKSFHCLRHTYATECARHGKPTPHIAQDLGHRSLSTTERYIHAAKE